ncbi:MAG: DMT family transporter [Clostridia bacterium]
MQTSQSNSTRKKAMLLMALCACLWSISGIFIKWISWSPFLIAGGRSLISAAVLGLFMTVSRIGIQVCRSSICAGISLGVSFLCFVSANKLTTAANAIVLQYTSPIFILIISALFLHQQIKKREAAVVCAAAAGILLFFLDQLSPGNIAGNLLGILAGLFLSIMFILIGLAGNNDSIRMSGILFAHIFTALVGIPVGAVFTASISTREICLILILGIFQLGIPYILYAIAAKDCSPLACSLIGMLEPLLNPVWVFLFDGESPGPFALAGAAIVIAAVACWCVIENRNQRLSELPTETEKSS